MRPGHPLIRRPPVGRKCARPCDRPRPLFHRLRALAEESAEVRGELARDARLATVEALLLAAEEPLTARRLADLAGLNGAAEARLLVERLRDLFDRGGSAFQVEDLAGGFQLLTRPEYHPWLTRLRPADSGPPLSAPARETLAIVAYRQPIPRADVEAIRGVGCSEVLRQLMDRGLVRIAGRDESLGRPQLYATTKKFLQVFGLRSLRDLPQAEGLTAPRQGKPAAEEPE